MLMANNFTELFRTLDINHILVAKVLWVYVKPEVQTKLASSNNLLAGAPQFNGAVDRWS